MKGVTRGVLSSVKGGIVAARLLGSGDGDGDRRGGGVLWRCLMHAFLVLVCAAV